MTAASSIEDCVASADVIVIATPWKEFSSLPQSAFNKGARKVIIDPRPVLDLGTYGDLADVMQLGTGGWRSRPAANPAAEAVG